MKHSENAVRLIKLTTPFFPKMHMHIGDPTIGYDHVIRRKIEEDWVLDKNQAEELLESDLCEVDRQISLHYELMKWSISKKCNQNRYDAIVCLIHQIGLETFLESEMPKALYDEDFDTIEMCFGAFTINGAGRGNNTSFELTIRRCAEWSLFQGTEEWKFYNMF